jgi:L-galactose dehydrogenase/L-glyceraldehyde 3-phosphate reductase
MELRKLGRTGLDVSLLGFGCGAVGGLMVRGDPAEQERAVARAVELGINYFDTAAFYGDGESEKNLGRVLAALRPSVLVGTKFRIAREERGRIAEAIETSLAASLRRLRREQVDLLQLHNEISDAGERDDLTSAAVLDEVVPALARLRDQGKIRFCGISAKGETDAIHCAIDARAVDTAQVIYNLLNPSAGAALNAGFPAQDFRRLLERTRAAGVGAIVIRVLAGGALSGSEERHPLGSQNVPPMGSGPGYRDDVERARLLAPLVTEGHAGSLVEASLRFAIANEGVGTVLVGVSAMAQLEYAAAAVAKGPLSPDGMKRARELQDKFPAARR